MNPNIIMIQRKCFDLLYQILKKWNKDNIIIEASLNEKY